MDDYQRINVNEDYLDRFVAYLGRLDALSGEYGIPFTFLAVPDKKSIYPEYFPEGYNIKDTTGMFDLLKQKLEHSGIDYLFLKDAFLEEKQKQQLYNVVYDAGHWNEHGSFYGTSLLIEHLRATHLGIPALTIDDYEVIQEVKTTLQVSHFPIHEEVPVYTHKHSTAVYDIAMVNNDPNVSQNHTRRRYVNPTTPNQLKLLIIGDSYMPQVIKLLAEMFGEVTFLHTVNLPLIRSHIETYQPDILVLEAVERVIGGVQPRMLTNEVIDAASFPLSMETNPQ